jgi:hypothetical protein
MCHLKNQTTSLRPYKGRKIQKGLIRKVLFTAILPLRACPDPSLMLFFVFVAALKAKKKADRKKKKKLKTRQANAEGAGGGGGGGAEREVQASSSSATVLSSLSLFPIPASPRSQLDYLQEANTRDKKLIESGRA